MENQAYSLSFTLIRLLPIPPLPPLSRQQIVSLSQSSRVFPVELTDGREGEERVGEEPSHTTARKPEITAKF
jgi:hypothetical protein